MSNSLKKIALIKATKLPSDASVSYWKPIGAAYSENEPQAVLKFAVFVTKKAHDSGKSPVDSVNIELSKEQTDRIRQSGDLPTKSLLIEIVSEAPLFAGATLVLEDGSVTKPVLVKSKLPKRKE